LTGYHKYVKGVYYQNPKLQSTIKGEKQKIVDALKEGYPNGFSAQELHAFTKHQVEENSAYQLCKELANLNFIISKTEKGKKRRAVQRYYFEDYNYIYNLREGSRLPFAPGYVEYEKNFLDIYEKIRNKELEDKIQYSLLEFLVPAIRATKNSGLLCKNCGYNHERRDFIRATLLRLIDDLETNRQFIEFIRNEGIIGETRHKELMSLAQRRTYPEEIGHVVDKSLVQVEPKSGLTEINKFLDELPAPIYFMGEHYLVKEKHDLQQIVLDYIIKKYPEKIKEIQDELGGQFISRNKFYTRQRGTRKISNGYYMEIKSPRDRIIRNCDRILKLAGLGRLNDVLTLNYQK
jgi:hypothetical protein